MGNNQTTPVSSSIPTSIPHHYLFKITINNQNKFKCSIININNNNEFTFNLQQNQDEYSQLSISFNMNEIIVDEGIKDSIEFINDLIEHPEEFKQYKITYQGQEYEVIAEVLLALIFYQYKNKIEKEFIIDETILQFETEEENNMLINRIKVALEAIDCRLNEFEIPEYDYQEQGEILQKILDKYIEYNKYKNIIRKSNQIELNKKELIELII